VKLETSFNMISSCSSYHGSSYLVILFVIVYLTVLGKLSLFSSSSPSFSSTENGEDVQCFHRTDIREGARVHREGQFSFCF